MADNSFKVKNSIVIQGIELDLSGASTDQVLTFNDVELDSNRLAFQMRRETEALLN